MTQQTQKPYNLEPNIESVVAYLFPPFTGIAVLIFERNNKFVRFHALQSVLFGIASFILSAIANMLVVVLIGILLVPLVSLGLFLAWLFLIWKAYQNEEYMLPIIGQVAKDQVNKTSSQ